jgi:serine/threonine protein kinase
VPTQELLSTKTAIMTSTPNIPLEEIFHGALELSGAAAREAYLDDMCAADGVLRARVEALLGAHQSAEDFLEEPLVENPSDAAIDAGPGTQIGHYKLLQQIGEGGRGVVYMAEQERPVRRKVALKVIKLGMDTKQVIARFEAERQALALMEHPNIARVLDAGSTDAGRPYFVMELVRGVPINEYCDKHQLQMAERMGLFIDTCRAVQHAHQKGIIHRDIKPGNVLVTSHDGTPVVKIIDFGVAKATHQKLTEKTLFTEFRQVIGTPEYMSPEQAEMSGLDVDTRTDIYSLGVLFYLLLTGSTPFEAKTLRGAGYNEMTRMIREDEPPTPSTRVSKLGVELEELARTQNIEPRALIRLMRGDIDWIVMRAMSKDRTRRYDSASALADDVARHLRDEPVLAGPPSSIYRITKMIRRNRVMFAGTALATLGLILGLGLALSGYFAAKAEAGRSRRISETLTSLLAVTSDGAGDGVEVEPLLATAREVFGDDHATVAATLSALAGQLRNSGDSRGAQDLYLKASETFRAAYGPDHHTVGLANSNLGIMQSQNGDTDSAILSLREALRIEGMSPARGALTGCATRRELAKLLATLAQYTEADSLLAEAIILLDREDPEQYYERLVLIEERIQVSFLNPQKEDLDPLFIELVGSAAMAFPTGNQALLNAKFGRAMYLGRAGRFAEAEPVLRDVLVELDLMESPPASYEVGVLDVLFQGLREDRDPARRQQAVDVLLRFISAARTLWGPDSEVVGQNMESALGFLHQNRSWTEALGLCDELLDYVKRNHDVETHLNASWELSGIVWKMVSASDPNPDPKDLNFALQLLDKFVQDDEKFVQRAALLRMAIQFQLGEEVDLKSAISLATQAADPDDSGTQKFLRGLTRLEKRGR